MTNDKYQMSNKSLKPKSFKDLKIKRFIWTLSLGFWILMFGFSANAQVSSTDLLNNPNSYNGKSILYKGEVVGDIMDHWVNINDGNAAIGIWVKEKIALDEIAYLGDYKTNGDQIIVNGIFNKACSAHGGDLDIHAQHLEVVKLGGPIEHPLDMLKVYSLLTLFGAVVLVYIVKTILFRRKS